MRTSSTTETRTRTFAEEMAPVFAAVQAEIADPAAHEHEADVTIFLRRDDSAASMLAGIAPGLMALQQGQSVTFRYVD